MSPLPPFVPGACGAVKQPCASDSDCPSGCERCRCFNANGAAANKTLATTCPMSYGGLVHQGFCSNDTQVHAPDCWEHPCGSCGGPPFPDQGWSKGKKQYLVRTQCLCFFSMNFRVECLLFANTRALRCMRRRMAAPTGIARF